MKQFLSAILLLTAFQCMHGGIVVTGNDSTGTPKAFKTAVTTKAFDRKTGTFFAGLEEGTDAFTISKASRPNFSTTPAFSSVLQSNSTLTSATIEFLLTLSPQSSGLGILSAVAKGSGSFTATNTVSFFTSGNPSPEISSGTLKDASGTSDTGGILQLTSSSNNLFAAVQPNSSFFGDTDSGIALIGIGPSGNTISVDVKDATTGNAGNKAAPLTRFLTVLKGTSGGQDVLITDTSAAMHWDQDLERLFIGLPVKSGNMSSDIAKGVVVARLVSGALTFQAIAPDSALSSFPTDEIIVGKGADISISPNHLSVMHASTGPDYLIVDCAATNICEDCTFTSTCNRVFALPLVNDTSNTTAATNGTLADKTSALNSSTKKFTAAAAAAGKLPVNNPEADPAAVVGAGDLPLEATETISDMVVVGDAVYVSISRSPNNLNDSGIWMSQAMFDNTGRVQRWTPWTAKRMIPLNAFPGITLPGGSTHSGSIKLFDVDGATGNVWFVEADTGKTVGITSWTTGVQSTDLITKLRTALTSSCYSVLDLNQNTRGFADTTRERYALFGGVNKVVFARTAQARDTADTSSPEIAITDYSSAENFLITTLPDNAGCCQVLEFSRTSTPTDNDDTRTNFGYFFAGTENGLFVFADSDGEGFNPIDLSTLNTTPFSAGSWQKVSTISGSVIDIKASSAVDLMVSGTGETLYVVTSESSATHPFTSKLLSIPFDSSIDRMFAQSNIRTIAQTSSGTFEKVIQFYGIQLIATDNPTSAAPEAKEQIILVTNQGLFKSNASQSGSTVNGIGDATTQSAASWQVLQQNVVKTTTKTMVNGIGGMDTPVRHTTWPFSIQDKSGAATFDRGAIHQYSGVGDSAGTDVEYATFFDPNPFNANSSLSAFTTLDRMIYFFSDGGRRFFIFNRTSDPADETKLAVVPYQIANWNVTAPSVLTFPTVAQEKRFYWVRTIGPTGIVLAGTENGVIGLQ